MRHAVAVAAGMMIAATPPSLAAGNEKPAFLVCDGFDFEINLEVRRIVEIYQDRAVVDGELYSLAGTNSLYTLRGPVHSGPLSARELAAVPFVISINRLDGAYKVDQPHKKTGSAEWSRPKDKGCVAAQQKF